MSDGGRESVELYVETAPYPQTIECPRCETENKLLIESTDLGGTACTNCGLFIDYVHSRYAGESADETEQATLAGGEQA